MQMSRNDYDIKREKIKEENGISALQAEGRRFESVNAHRKSTRRFFSVGAFLLAAHNSYTLLFYNL